MGESQYLYLSHNVSNLVYHIVCLAKYRRVVFDETVDEHLRQICLEIEKRYDYIRVVRKLKMWYNLSARYERRKLESSLYGVTLIHI